MPDFPTFSDLFRVERDEVLARNAKLSLEAVERDGTDANVLLAAAAAAGDEVVAQLIAVCAAQYIDSAQGSALDKLAFDRYGLVRKPASPATGSVQFRTTVANPATFTIPIGTVVQTPDGIQFVTTGAVIFLIGSVGPVVATVRSVLAGASQQAQTNTITSIVSPIPGQPTDLKVNNPLATAGADDAEIDADLRDRARQFFVTARRGTLAAIEQGALAVPGVRRATAIEVIDVLGRPARVVELVIADAFTDALVQQNTNPVSYQVQSQSLSQTVYNGLLDVRAAGIFVQVFVAQVIVQPIVLNLTFNAGVDANFVALIARATVVATVNSLRPGQTLVLQTVLTALQGVAGLAFTGNEIESPAGDIVPLALQVIRTSLNQTTICVAIQTDGVSAILANTTNPDNFIQV
jgi:hypothetical protein